MMRDDCHQVPGPDNVSGLFAAYRIRGDIPGFLKVAVPRQLLQQMAEPPGRSIRESSANSSLLGFGLPSL